MIRLPVFCVLLAGLALAAPAAVSAETWLRGRHGEVWIEEDGKYQPPRENRRGFTKVATTRRPVVYVDPPVQRRYVGPTVIVRDPVVVYDAVPWYGIRHYRRSYYGGRRYDHARPYRPYYRSHHRGYRAHRGYRGHGGRSFHRGGRVRGGRSSLGAVYGVRGAVGGRGRRR